MPSQSLDYSPSVESADTRRIRRIAACIVVVVALAITLPIAANAYASAKFAVVKPGMAQGQVDRVLWLFAKNRNAVYNSVGPGGSAISYQLPGFGTFAEIKVIFKADGTVDYPIPVFNN